MIDIHTHILPGIDDGSPDIECTKQMLDMMSLAGVKRVVATPHFYGNTTVDKFVRRRDGAYAKVVADTEGVPEIVLGAEVFLEYGMHQMEDLAKLCIGDTNYILIEMPYSKWDEWVYDELFRIRAKQNLEIIIAHLDRYVESIDKEHINKLLKMDFKIQVNVDKPGLRRKSHTISLMKKNRVDFIATDCHDSSDRKPYMDKAAKKITRIFGKDYFYRLMNNAEMMLENQNF